MSKIIPAQIFMNSQEIADNGFNEMPATERGIQIFAKNNKWQEADKSLARPRSDGGGGWEYNPSIFPIPAQLDFINKYYANINAEAQAKNPDLFTEMEVEKQSVQVVDASRILSDSEVNERDAKLYILSQSIRFRDQYNGTKNQADTVFCEMYNSGQADFEVVIYPSVKTISVVSLKRWRRTLNEGDYSALASHHGGRKGVSFFDTALGGEIGLAIVGYMLHQSHYTAHHIRDLIIADFGSAVEIDDIEKHMSHIRSFERWIKNFEEENSNLLTRITDPNAFKNHTEFTDTNMNSHVKYFNQKWEIDASPTDILTTEGRRNLYALIDIHSRRVMIHISKSASTEASLTLIKRAIMEWGVPQEISTDNGSDFISGRFKLALNNLSIHQHICSPFSPEQKGTVEHVIGMINRDLMPTLAGFIGHNVTDRKKLEARNSFANCSREKSTDAFCVEVTPEQLQKYCDSWANDKYAHRKHGTLGVTPFQKQQSCTKPVRIIKNERELDLLLPDIASDGGFRIVTKHGIKLNDEYYLGGALVVGDTVFIRHDPDNAGRLLVFDEDKNTFLCEAICPALHGVDPKQLGKEIKHEQAASFASDAGPMIKASKKIRISEIVAKILNQGVASNKGVEVFSMQEIAHTNDRLEIANEALAEYQTIEKHDVPQAEIVNLVDVKKSKENKTEIIKGNYDRRNQIIADLQAGKMIDSDDKI
ncbi:MAG: transposase [Alphaproteobacteria bacterium]|nr:transposase [Alphaproteobacteria bacterium]